MWQSRRCSWKQDKNPKDEKKHHELLQEKQPEDTEKALTGPRLEKLWEGLKQSKNITELEAQSQEEWVKNPKTRIERHLAGYVKHLQAVISVKGVLVLKECPNQWFKIWYLIVLHKSFAISKMKPLSLIPVIVMA